MKFPTFNSRLLRVFCLAWLFGVPGARSQGPAAAPLKIGIIGDSTVCLYPVDSPQRGWGQVLPEFFLPSVLFLNTAQGGRSTKTFPPEKWRQILDFHPDFILIQFGHNDSHDMTHPEATDAEGDYKENLRRFVNEARQHGAIPVLVTPMHRCIFDKTTHQLTSELLPYATAMKEVAAELRVPVIDLYERSGTLLQTRGEEGSLELFMCGTINDRTHFTVKGARETARLVAAGAAEADPRLKAALRPAQP